MKAIVRFLIETVWPPARWARLIREENVTERLWYIENVIPFWRDTWPRIVMRDFHRTSIAHKPCKANAGIHGAPGASTTKEDFATLI